MASMAPPRPPFTVTLEDDNGKRRLRLRFWQSLFTFLTVLATTWCCTLGAIPAIIALAFAKHILVAILIMGIGVDARPDEPWRS